MKILILEDRAMVLHHLAEMMENHGHEILACTSPADATFHIAKEDTIDCIVADLSMSARGLTEEHARRSQGGLLTGWVWLVEYVFKRGINAKCIVFSDYTFALKQYLQERPEEQKYLDNVTLIPKSDIDALFLLNNAVDGFSAARKENSDRCRSIFLSFCSQDCDIADIVEQRLQKHFGKGISISRWERDVKYKDSFQKFMDSLKDHDYTLSIISDHYLKSRACMYEIGKIIDEPSFQKKLLYIVLSDEDKQYYKKNQTDPIAANVYNLASHFEYLTYWKDEYETLSHQADKVGIFVVSPEHRALVYQTKKILDDIQKFLTYIYDARGIPFNELMNTDFKVIKDAISTGH